MVVHGRKTRFSIAKKAALDLICQTKQGLPVDICKVAELLGFVVEEAEISWAGYLAAGENSIVVRRSDTPARKRFTIAHEIGHVLWRKACELSVKEKRLFKGRVCSEEEIIANKLATELLMPMPEFQKALQGYRHPSFWVVNDIAHLFGVSFTACARRITEHPDVLGFVYLYEIYENRMREYDFRAKKGYSTGNKLRFLTPPFDIVRKCLQHCLHINATWSGEIRFQKDEDQIQIPSVGKVKTNGHQTCVTLLGWRYLDSPVVSTMQANQLVAF